MTTFRDGFMMKSPLPAHGKLKKQLEILKNDPELAVKKGLSTEGQGGKDYEAIAAVEKKIKEAKAKHSSERRESDSAQVREDEDAARGSAAEMHTPLHNYGGYRGGGDVGQYISTADLYQNMFNKVESAAKDFIAGQENPDYEGKSKRQAKRVARRTERSKKMASKGKDTTKFDKKTNFISAKSTTNQVMADKQKQSAYDKLANLMSDEDKKKYGIKKES